MTELLSENSQLMDHHLMMVGKLVNNAALCDAFLFSAFKIISGCTQEIAIAIYYSSESLPAKKNLVKRILKAIKDKEKEKIINRISFAAEKANNQRNELSHALLKYQDGQFLVHNPRQQDQTKKQLTGNYLGSLLKHSTMAYLEAYKSYHQLCQRRGISPTIDLG
jgi:hypothetical protein